VIQKYYQQAVQGNGKVTGVMVQTKEIPNSKFQIPNSKFQGEPPWDLRLEI